VPPVVSVEADLLGSICKDYLPERKWLMGLQQFNGFDPDIRLDRNYTRGIEVPGCRCHGESKSSDYLSLILSLLV
jgi:hypothetical protein